MGNEDDFEPDEKYRNPYQGDDIGNIEDILTKNDLEYVKKTLDSSSSNSNDLKVDNFRDLFDTFKRKNKSKDRVTDKYPNKERLIILADTRSKDGDDTIYCYQPPLDCRNVSTFPEWGLFVNQANLLPNQSDTDNETAAELLTLSFQVLQKDEIRCYLFWNGSKVRFLPSDLRILPLKIFNMDWNNGENRKYIDGNQNLDKIIESMTVVIRDTLFTNFCEFCDLGKK